MQTNFPFTADELDKLIRACIAFTDEHEQYFCASHIAGRLASDPDSDSVRRMMDWVVETDKGVLEYSGFGKDNVEYFRLGLNARQMMSDGGFRKYIFRKRTSSALEQVKHWLPIILSLFALLVSIFAWQAPKNSSQKIDDLTAQLIELKVRQEQTEHTVQTVQEKLQTRLPTDTSQQSKRIKATTRH